MQIECKNKKSQYFLAIVVSILSFLHYMNIDGKGAIVWQFPLVTLIGLGVVTAYWNRWLYDEFLEGVKFSFSYNVFQCFWTLVLIALTIFFVVIYDYIPNGYNSCV